MAEQDERRLKEVVRAIAMSIFESFSVCKKNV